MIFLVVAAVVMINLFLKRSEREDGKGETGCDAIDGAMTLRSLPSNRRPFCFLKYIFKSDVLSGFEFDQLIQPELS